MVDSKLKLKLKKMIAFKGKINGGIKIRINCDIDRDTDREKDLGFLKYIFKLSQKNVLNYPNQINCDT